MVSRRRKVRAAQPSPSLIAIGRTNLREAWAKRRYEPHFLSKLTDCDGENAETDTSLDFALACGYITPDDHRTLTRECIEIGAMLGAMIANPEPFLIANQRRDRHRSPDP